MVRRPSSSISNVAVFIILEVASLFILASFSDNKRMWLKGITNDIHGTIWQSTAKIGDYFRLDKENERLHEENAFLLNDVAKMSAHQLDSVRWKAWRTNFSATPAHIISVNRGSLHNYFIIDRGSRDGVEKDDGIITPRGVIGIVHSVGLKFSYALSLKNKDMAVSARVGHDGYVGILQWNGHRSDESVLCNVPIHIIYTPGDTLFTSGYSSIFPPEIPLGTLMEMSSDDGSSAEIKVKLFSDYGRTNNVFVVKNLDRKDIQSLSE